MDYFKSICRLCAEAKNIKHNLETDPNQLIDKLCSITPEIFIDDENLPKQICTSCYEHLEQAYFFKKKCLDSHNELLRMWKQLNNDTIIIKKIEKMNTIPAIEPVYIKEEKDNQNVISDFDYDSDNCADTGETQSDSIGFTVIFNETQVKLFKCNSCPKTFTRSNSCKVHVRIHSGIKPYKCDVCSKVFTQKNHLKSHLLQHSNETPFKCELCEKSYTRKDSYQYHLRKHANIKPFSCVICAKSFIQKQKLQQHLRLHSGERPYKCPICEKTFSQKQHRDIHQKIHTSDRPFQCEFCKKPFRHKDGLANHLRKYHRNENRYTCHRCGTAFARLIDFRYHMRVHSTEQPFMCNFCEKPFYRVDVFRRHIRIVHNSEPPI